MDEDEEEKEKLPYVYNEGVGKIHEKYNRNWMTIVFFKNMIDVKVKCKSFVFQNCNTEDSLVISFPASCNRMYRIVCFIFNLGPVLVLDSCMADHIHTFT